MILGGHYITSFLCNQHCTSGHTGLAVSKGKNSFKKGKTGIEAHMSQGSSTRDTLPAPIHRNDPYSPNEELFHI